MNRIIKFRGKDLEYDIWVYGSLLVWPDGEMYIAESGKPGDIVLNEVEVNPSTVGQFTGLYDANGKEIYENDIVQMSISEDSIGVVKYSTDSAAFIVQMKNSTQWFYLWSGYKVVGNIHDNLSLLKGGIDGSH